MDQELLTRAEDLIRERVEAAGGQVETAKAIPKAKGAIIVTVHEKGFDGERQAIVTEDEVK